MSKRRCVTSDGIYERTLIGMPVRYRRKGAIFLFLIKSPLALEPAKTCCFFASVEGEGGRGCLFHQAAKFAFRERAAHKDSGFRAVYANRGT